MRSGSKPRTGDSWRRNSPDRGLLRTGRVRHFGHMRQIRRPEAERVGGSTICPGLDERTVSKNQFYRPARSPRPGGVRTSFPSEPSGLLEASPLGLPDTLSREPPLAGSRRVARPRRSLARMPPPEPAFRRNRAAHLKVTDRQFERLNVELRQAAALGASADNGPTFSRDRL